MLQHISRMDNKTSLLSYTIAACSSSELYIIHVHMYCTEHTELFPILAEMIFTAAGSPFLRQPQEYLV